MQISWGLHSEADARRPGQQATRRKAVPGGAERETAGFMGERRRENVDPAAQVPSDSEVLAGGR